MRAGAFYISVDEFHHPFPVPLPLSTRGADKGAATQPVAADSSEFAPGMHKCSNFVCDSFLCPRQLLPPRKHLATLPWADRRAGASAETIYRRSRPRQCARQRQACGPQLWARGWFPGGSLGRGLVRAAEKDSNRRGARFWHPLRPHTNSESWPHHRADAQLGLRPRAASRPEPGGTGFRRRNRFSMRNDLARPKPYDV